MIGGTDIVIETEINCLLNFTTLYSFSTTMILCFLGFPGGRGGFPGFGGMGGGMGGMGGMGGGGGMPDLASLLQDPELLQAFQVLCSSSSSFCLIHDLLTT